jgi:hypothetical protein
LRKGLIGPCAIGDGSTFNAKSVPVWASTHVYALFSIAYLHLRASPLRLGLPKITESVFLARNVEPCVARFH